MRITLLLFILLMSGQLFGQDTIKSLVITEVRLHPTTLAILEVTNMGNEDIQLNQFKIGQVGAGSSIVDGKITAKSFSLFPDYMLKPGESFVIASVKDYGPEQFKLGSDDFGEKSVPDNLWDEIDVQIHLSESQGDPTDSVTPNNSPFNEQWHGMSGFFIQQQLSNGDSCVVDQVGGMFLGEGGKQLNRTEGDGYDVAGFTKATKYAYLVRKFSVKKGNLDFASAVGIGIDDSEWIPIPIFGEGWRNVPWTVGNHGNFALDSNTLKSSVIKVDLGSKTLTVPWGVRRMDAFMQNFDKVPGLGWEYVLNGVSADSLSTAAHTGDKLILYVCGNTLIRETFDIIVEEPTASVNSVVPVLNGPLSDGTAGTIISGYQPWPRVTAHASGTDTIWGPHGGIPYATRIDSLLERLEKPSIATWEIAFANGVDKPDLIHGDKLKVTAQNGSVKEYFIALNPYRPNDDTDLSAITWPDIPEFYKGIFGWAGDTIPGFGPKSYVYNVEVPLMAEGIPAMVAKATDLKATVEVKRAKSLSGTSQDRTTTFTVVAENEVDTKDYKVILNKEVSIDDIQPNEADPFISEVVQNWGWSGIDILELCNPGNQPLDLSDYMLVGFGGALGDAIATTNVDNYGMRYEKYIPGYKWTAEEATWSAGPYIAEKDLSVNAIVEQSDVFTMAYAKGTGTMCSDVWKELPTGNPLMSEIDVQFNTVETPCYNFTNQWGETISANGTPFTKPFEYAGVALYKILNDSIKKGLKPATDPNDFELLDVLGGNGKDWKLQGGEINRNNPFSFSRKADITTGNPEAFASFGVAGDPESVEWDLNNMPYWNTLNAGWPRSMTWIIRDIGKHFFNSPTDYRSTISSTVYKVSEGFSMEEEIRGVKSGTTVADFFANIIKADTAQTLTVLSGGVALDESSQPKNGDVLHVLSADGQNESQYVLNVSEEGLSSDALLTSEVYTVAVSENPNGAAYGVGTVSGMEYGTSLESAVANLVVPDFASLNIINGNDAFVPYKKLNYDSVYVDVAVNTDIYLEVVAEDGVTGIVYHLMPTSSESDAFVTSNLFSVDQEMLIIQLVPKGITVANFLANVIPSFGANIQVVDKMGFDRNDGVLADDDRLVVTSSDGTKSVNYFIATLDLNLGTSNFFFAYILSDLYAIDQGAYVIDGVKERTTVEEFLGNVVASLGATVTVHNADGTPKTSGEIVVSDLIKVALADASFEVTYTLSDLIVGNKEVEFAQQIMVYPNPSNGNINVVGLKNGQRLNVYNFSGAIVKQLVVDQNHEQISIDDQPNGIYMIVVTNQAHNVVARYKALKR